MGERGPFLSVCQQGGEPYCKQQHSITWVATESISHFLCIPGFFFLGFRVFFNFLSAVNVSLSRAACSSSRHFIRETFAATAELDNCCLSGQEVKCQPLQREAGSQDSHQRWHVTGDTERQWRVSFLQTVIYFSKVWAAPAAAAGSVLALDQTCDKRSSNRFGDASQTLVQLTPASSLLIWKGFSKITFFFFVENKKHLPIQCRLDLLVSQRPCKLLIQVFAATLRWKEPHLTRSTPSCLNSSTQFIHFSYKIVLSFKFAWSEPRKF